MLHWGAARRPVGRCQSGCAAARRSGGEARQALRNLATEGIEIRKQIARELSRPAQAALEVSDVRTSQGMSRFMSLATGREDPAIEQMRQQLGKLEEIRRELQRVGANPVDILGA